MATTSARERRDEDHGTGRSPAPPGTAAVAIGARGAEAAPVAVTDAPRALAAAPVISYADRFGFLPMVAVAGASLHTSVPVMSAAVTVYFLMYGVAQPVIGVLSDRFGRVPVLRVALWALAGADLVAALAPTAHVLLAARGLAGVASGALLPTTLVYLGDTVDFQLRQRAVARVLAAASLAAGIAMALAGWLAYAATWRIPLLLIAISALLVAGALGRLPKPPRTASPVRIREIISAWPAVAGLLVFALAEGAAMLGFFTFFAPMLEASGHSTTTAGLVVGVYGIAAVLGARLLRTVPARLVPVFPLVTGGILLVGGYVFVAVSQNLASVLLASVLLGAAFSLFHSTFQTLATDLIPRARGLVTSLFVAAVFTGAAIGSAWGAIYEARHAYQGMFTVAAVLSVAVVLVGAAMRLRYPAGR